MKCMIQIELLRECPVDSNLWLTWRSLARGVAMRQPEWLISWWDTYAPEDGELFLLTAWSGNQLIGLIPWYRLKSERQLRMLGDGDVCTDYNGVLCKSDEVLAGVTEGFTEWLLEHCKDREVGWDSIYMEGIPLADALTRGLKSSLEKQSGPTMERNPMNTWCVDLAGGWEAFLSRASRDTRKRLRRRLASLSEVKVHQVQSTDDWGTFYPILVNLHQKRRNSLGEPGCFADSRFRSFLEVASLRLLPLGQLAASHLEKEGQPVAADIGFRSSTHWYCYQSGIETAAMDIEPGKMSNIWMIHEASSLGLNAIDFLRGDEPYKKQLKADPRPICDLWIASPGWKGISQKWLWQSKQIVAGAARNLYGSIPFPLPFTRS